MFKSGDSVLVPGGSLATVKAVLRDSQKVETTGGTYDEAELSQAHPSVLQTVRAEVPDYITEIRSRHLSKPKKVPTTDPALRQEVKSA